MKVKSAILLLAIAIRASAPPLTLYVAHYTPNYTEIMGEQMALVTVGVSNTVQNITNNLYLSTDLTNWVLYDQILAPGAGYRILELVPMKYPNVFFKMTQVTP